MLLSPTWIPKCQQVWVAEARSWELNPSLLGQRQESTWAVTTSQSLHEEEAGVKLRYSDVRHHCPNSTLTARPSYSCSIPLLMYLKHEIIWGTRLQILIILNNLLFSVLYLSNPTSANLSNLKFQRIHNSTTIIQKIQKSVCFYRQVVTLQMFTGRISNISSHLFVFIIYYVAHAITEAANTTKSIYAFIKLIVYGSVLSQVG